MKATKRRKQVGPTFFTLGYDGVPLQHIPVFFVRRDARACATELRKVTGVVFDVLACRLTNSGGVR